MPHTDHVGIGDPAGGRDQRIQVRVTIETQCQRRQRVAGDDGMPREVGDDPVVPRIDDVGIGDPAGGRDQSIQVRVTIERNANAASVSPATTVCVLTIRRSLLQLYVALVRTPPRPRPAPFAILIERDAR